MHSWKLEKILLEMFDLRNQDYSLVQDLFIRIKYIREVEEFISSQYISGLFRCPVHLSIGQEGIAAGVSAHLRIEDRVISTHRSHAHYLAKGGSLYKFFCELMGRVEGCCGGRGGSMHIFDDEVGFMGSVPIVGSALPIAGGIASYLKQEGKDNIAVCYLGDASLETGQFYESLNFISLWKLPILIILEDNGYSTYAPKELRQPLDIDLKHIVESFGISFSEGSGDDPFEVYNISREQVKIVRSGHPCLVRFSTYRLLEHCGPNRDDDLNYRRREELNLFESRDPILKMKREISNLNFNEWAKEISEQIKFEVLENFERAKITPFAGIETDVVI